MEGSCLFLENIYEIRPVNGEKRAMGIWEHRRGKKKEKKKNSRKEVYFQTDLERHPRFSVCGQKEGRF